MVLFKPEVDKCKMPIYIIKCKRCQRVATLDSFKFYGYNVARNTTPNTYISTTSRTHLQRCHCRGRDVLCGTCGNYIGMFIHETCGECRLDDETFLFYNPEITRHLVLNEQTIKHMTIADENSVADLLQTPYPLCMICR